MEFGGRGMIRGSQVGRNSTGAKARWHGHVPSVSRARLGCSLGGARDDSEAEVCEPSLHQPGTQVAEGWTGHLK